MTNQELKPCPIMDALNIAERLCLSEVGAAIKEVEDYTGFPGLQERKQALLDEERANLATIRKARAIVNTRPSPEVRVKPLEWEHLGGDYYRACSPLIVNIRIERYGSGGYRVLYSVPGYSNTFVEGEFPTLSEAKFKAHEKYEACILSALQEAE